MVDDETLDGGDRLFNFQADLFESCRLGIAT